MRLLISAASAISGNRVFGYAAVSSPASSPRGCTIGTGRVRCPPPFWSAFDRAWVDDIAQFLGKARMALSRGLGRDLQGRPNRNAGRCPRSGCGSTP